MSDGGTVASAHPKKRIKTGAAAVVDRTFSPRLVGEVARALQDAEVVDDAVLWDQLTSWWPTVLWRPEVTRLAEAVRDPDSFHDAFQLAAFAAAATERLGVTISTDAVRRGPAELMQTMLTLAGATEGHATLLLGAGELKQTRPFGYKRTEGLARLEDLLRIFRLLWESAGPVDFDGNVWKLRKAWLGEVRPNRPRFIAMGGGQRLLDIAVEHADGWVTDVPGAVSTANRYSELVRQVRAGLEGHGRDPEDFELGILAPCLVHEDPEVIGAAQDTPLIKFSAATIGRLNMSDWLDEGLDPIFPADWHYSTKLLPTEMSRSEVDAIVSSVPASMVEKSFIAGGPKQVAHALEEYVEAGATWIGAVDFLPSLRTVDEAAGSLERSIEVCRYLKMAV